MQLLLLHFLSRGNEWLSSFFSFFMLITTSVFFFFFSSFFVFTFNTFRNFVCNTIVLVIQLYMYIENYLANILTFVRPEKHSKPVQGRRNKVDKILWKAILSALLCLICWVRIPLKSSPTEVLYKKKFSKINIAKFRGKQLCRSLFITKRCRLKACNFFDKEIPAQMFPSQFCNI